MTLNVLTFNIGATLYFAIGSWIEERRLARLYGQVYRDYCRRVPWPLPCPRLDSGHE
jgi:protein-S-isoprenylcysteine O-methyltransferase Ste14